MIKRLLLAALALALLSAPVRAAVNPQLKWVEFTAGNSLVYNGQALNGATSLIWTPPGSVGLNDLLILFLTTSAAGGGTPVDPGVVTPPAGWTCPIAFYDSVADVAARITTCWKRAGAIEPATYTFSWPTADLGTGFVWANYAYTAQSGSPLDDIQSVKCDGLVTTCNGAIATAVGSSDLQLTFWTVPKGASGPFTPGAGLTYLAQNNANSSDRPEIVLGVKQLAASGGTGTFTLTWVFSSSAMSVTALLLPCPGCVIPPIIPMGSPF